MADNPWSEYLTKKIPYSGELPLRQDLRDLSKEQLYLYVEGLKRFQDPEKAPVDDPLSYYQIAGIHGLPFTKWPDKGWNVDIPTRKLHPGEFGGFCTHSSILFLTWHRPYLSLFENCLRNHVKAIAAGISDSHAQKQQYMKLAENFRLPYWDWAKLKVQIVPEICLNEKFRPDGPPSKESSKKDYNPLFHYPFPEGTNNEVTMTGKDNAPYKSTVRYPDPQGQNDNILWKMQDFYKEPGKTALPPLIPERNLTERTAYILQSYRTYAAMSNDKYRVQTAVNRAEKAERWGSLEDIHNAVHNLTGGTGDADAEVSFGGHMSHVPNSAFDPIFWLHHTNIDRLFDIWQALHQDDSDPNTFVTTQKAGMGGITIPKNGSETMETPLYPFRPTVDSWYKSNTVKKTEEFGYSYPETNGLSYPSTPEQKKKLYEKISNEYEFPAKMISDSIQEVETAGESLLGQSQILKELESKKVTATAEHQASLAAKLPDNETLLKASLGRSKPVLRDLAPQGKYLEWITNIKSAKHVLDGAYSVHVFLGAPDEQRVALWPSAPTHVGTFAPLGQSRSTGCAKCQEDQEAQVEVTGQIPLTLALIERYLAGLIRDLTPASVVPYLTKNLHWRVAKNDGTVVEDRSQVTGLTVFVITNEVTIPKDASEIPTYADDVEIYPEITTNTNGDGRGDGTGLTAGELPS